MDYPGRLIAITRILVIKERGRRIRIREGDVMMEAEVQLMQLLALKMVGGRHELRNAGGL